MNPWRCLMCGSEKQPKTFLPRFGRFGNGYLQIAIPNAKTCSPACAHARQRQRRERVKK